MKVIADFPPVVDGVPSGPAEPTYSGQAIEAMVAAVHAAGGRVAAHATTGRVSQLVRAGVDSIEHGMAITETDLRLMAQAGTAWTPTLCAVLGVPGSGPQNTGAGFPNCFPSHRLGVPIMAGTDTTGPLAREITLLAEHGLGPAAALYAATTTAYQFLGEPFDQTGQPAALVTYPADPRGDLATLSVPAAIIIDGTRVR